jgi:hypothetical protein
MGEFMIMVIAFWAIVIRVIYNNVYSWFEIYDSQSLFSIWEAGATFLFLSAVLTVAIIAFAATVEKELRKEAKIDAETSLTNEDLYKLIEKRKQQNTIEGLQLSALNIEKKADEEKTEQ